MTQYKLTDREGKTAMLALTVRYATEPDGLGRPVTGWRAYTHGVAIGNCCATKAQAIENATIFVAMTNRTLAGV